MTDALDMIALSRDLCDFRTGVVADENVKLFARLGEELPLQMFPFASGDTYNGWIVTAGGSSTKMELRPSTGLPFMCGSPFN